MCGEADEIADDAYELIEGYTQHRYIVSRARERIRNPRGWMPPTETSHLTCPLYLRCTHTSRLLLSEA